MFCLVDFDKETTIATPATDILHKIILEKRHYFLESLEYYHEHNLRSNYADTSRLRARLYNLFSEIKTSFKRSESAEAFKEIQELVEDDKLESIILAFNVIDGWLYEKRLTQFDNKKHIDRKDIEADNEANL